MRWSVKIVSGVCLMGVLSGCGGSRPEEGELKALNVLDESNLSEVMLTAADPAEAVAYFRRSTAEQPDRIDLARGLARSLVRAKSPVEAVAAWRRVVAMPDSNSEDQVQMADAQIRAGQWSEAEITLDGIPPTYETFKRYRLEAMVADSNKEWKKADSFYETALGLTTTPAGVLNNWGYSKLTRGAYGDAERLFGDALRQDPKMFTAKNNLVLARGAQRRYTLPVIPMTQIERARLMHTMALTAIKQGDVNTGKTLLREAIETHPQHFEEAVRSLRALEGQVGG